MKPLLTLAAMLAATAAFSGTTSEPPRDPRVYGDHRHGHMMQPCGPGYSVGHWSGGNFNPQDHCGDDNVGRRQTVDSPDRPSPIHPRPTFDRPSVKGNNGWGNGSQDAPGKSGSRNNAENGPKGKNDGRGKNSGNSGRKGND